MGSIGLAALLVRASAAEPMLDAVLMTSPQVHGAPMQVEVLMLGDGSPVDDERPDVAIDGGELMGVSPVGRGRWRVEILPELNQSTASISVGWRGLQRELIVQTTGFPEPHLQAASAVRGPVGERLTFKVGDVLGHILDSTHLRADSPEGKLEVACGGAAECTIDFVPDGSPFPRIVPIFIHDERHPTRAPLVIPAKLYARPSIPVTTEAGATARMSIGDRIYGPETAGPDGRVRFDVRVEPGDREAVVELEDTLGNKQTSAIVIGGVQGAALALSGQGSIIEGGLAPRAVVAVFEPDGRPASGPIPDCEGLIGERVFPVGPGLWGGFVDTSVVQDKRVGCHVPSAEPASMRVDVERSRATRLVLQSYPTRLSADIPIAEVQAYLINGVGERLPPGDIAIEAQLGRVFRDQPGPEPIVRARYDGVAAAAAGGDVVTASWRRPAGKGGVWDLAIRGAAPSGSGRALVDARAVDQGGRPIDGVSGRILLGNERADVVTSNGGWATATFPWPEGADYAVAQIQVGSHIRSTFVVKDDPAAAAVGAPDLVTELTVPIRAGRVHGVVLNPTPRQLTNDGQVGTISVRLEDQNRNLVSGGAVKIDVSQGIVGPVQARPNGEWVATLAPPVGMRPGPIRVTATTADGQFSASTDLVVVNRTVDWTLGFRGGVLLGHGAPVPLVGLIGEWKTPIKGLYARGDSMFYRLSASSTDPITKSAVEMEKQVYPLGLGVAFRNGEQRWPFWVGGRLVVSPYALSVSQGGSVSTRGWGWLPPGAGLFAGIAARLWGGEAFTEVEYLFLSAPDQSSGWSGPVGGVVGTVGYKLLY